jgi:hypothetical protein
MAKNSHAAENALNVLTKHFPHGKVVGVSVKPDNTCDITVKLKGCEAKWRVAPGATKPVVIQ